MSAISTQKTQRSPLEDTRDLILSVPPVDRTPTDTVLENIANFTGPQPVLGRWNNPVAWLAAWQGTDRPKISRPLVAVFAGSHNVAAADGEKALIEAAQKRVKGVTEGRSTVRGIAQTLGAAFKVYEMGLEYPAADIRKEPALSPRDCAAAIAFGFEVIAEGADIIVLGSAGWGSATAAAAIARGLYGGTSSYWAGAHDSRSENRIQAVETAIETHRDHLSDPLAILQCFGGRDLAGLVGAILAARHQSIPVILDGFVVSAAAAILHQVNPAAVEHCVAGHLSVEPAHGALLDRLGLTPLHNFGLSLGDGTGGAYALGTLQASVGAYGTLVS